jgi:hypothetical protein
MLAVVAILAALLVTAAACGEANEAPEAPTATHLETTFDVTPQPGVHVLDPATVDTRLVAADPVYGEYRFAATAEQIRMLEPGDVVVIPGHGLGSVRAIFEHAGEIVLRLDDAALDDVIQEGLASWRYDVAWDDVAIDYQQIATLPGVTDVEVVYDQPQTTRIGSQAPAPRAVMVSFRQSGWEFALELEARESRLYFDLTGELAATSESATIATVAASGWVSGFTYVSAMRYAEGAPTAISSAVNGLQGETEISWTAYRTPRTTITQAVRVDVPIAMPFLIPGPLGIPFSLQLKAAGRIVPELDAVDSSSGGGWKVAYSSDQGFTLDASTGTVGGGLLANTIGTTRDTVTAGLGPAGFGVGLEFPRFELGVAGRPPFAFITVDAYSSSRWTPGTTLTSNIPPCQHGATRLAAIGGYRLDMVGWEGRAQQHTLWERQVDTYLNKRPCTSTGS